MMFRKIVLLALAATLLLSSDLPAQFRFGKQGRVQMPGVRSASLARNSGRVSGMNLARQYLRNQANYRSQQLQAQQKLLAQQQEQQRLAAEKKQQQRQAAADAARAAKERARERAQARAKEAAAKKGSSEKKSEATRDDPDAGSEKPESHEAAKTNESAA
jgi:hypothetical protein